MKLEGNRTAILIGVLISIFLGGVLVGTSISKAPEKIVEKVEVEKNGEAWRELKAIDDELIKVSVANTELCSGAMYAAINNDEGTLEAINGQIKENRAKFKVSSDARLRVTKDLGY